VGDSPNIAKPFASKILVVILGDVALKFPLVEVTIVPSLVRVVISPRVLPEVS
jgi:hypothetical protein